MGISLEPMPFYFISLYFTPSTNVIFLTAYLAVVLVGLVGNVLVIIVVVKTPQMKTVTNYFILNLAIADLLALIFWLSTVVISTFYAPWVTRSLMGSLMFSLIAVLMCKAVPYIQGVAVCASAYSLAAISGGRLMATWFPLRPKVTKSVARWIIVLIWIWAAGLALPWLVFTKLISLEEAIDIDIHQKEPPVIECSEWWPSRDIENIYFWVVNVGLFYLFPLSFISFCYLGIWLRLRRRNVPTDSSASQMELVHQRTKASVQKLAIVIVAAFALCWLPLYVVWSRIRLPMLPRLGKTEEEVFKYALSIAQWLGIANSCMNPIFYAFFNQNFRVALKRLFRGPPTYTRPRSCPSPHLLHNPNQAARCRTNWVRLNTAFQRSHRRRSQLKSTRHNASNRRVSDVVMLDQKSPKPPAIPRSQSY